MPRSNRSRGARREDPDGDLSRLLTGWRRTELRRGATWTVQPVTGAQALKEYRCPGCVHAIEPGTAHVVVWRADGPLGDSANLADRRHWHTHCWRLA